jgi:hypothetical protein
MSTPARMAAESGTAVAVIVSGCESAAVEIDRQGGTCSQGLTMADKHAILDDMSTSNPSGWSRVAAGHYYTRRWNAETHAHDQIHARIYTVGPGKDDWELTINGRHAAYGGRLAELKRIVEARYARH